jgi:flagellar basal body-associated protein FliL
VADEPKVEANPEQKPHAAKAAEAPEEKAGPKKRGNPLAPVIGVLGNKVTFIVSLVIVEVLVAYFVVTALIEPRLAGEPVVKTEEKDAAHAKHVEGPMMHIDKVVVNLTGSEEPRYLAAGLSIELDPGDEKLDEEHLKERVPKAKDVVIYVLSSKGVDEVKDVQGREIVREEIKDRLEAALAPIKVHGIYFTEFVVQ